MSDVVNQKQAQQVNVSNADLLKEIKGLTITIGILSAKVDALEGVGKDDKAVEPPSKKNHNDDVGPYAHKVYDKRCIVCGNLFKTENESVSVCQTCALAKRAEDADRLAKFNQE